MQPRAAFYQYQVIGMLIIVLIPVLALAGVFGTRTGSVDVASETLALTVKYPEIFRYKTVEPFMITAENISEQPQEVVVTIDVAYLSQFSNVQFTPEPDKITDEEYIFRLGTLETGGEALIAGEIESEQYGQLKGTVAAYVGTTTPPEVRTELETISLP